MQALLQQTVIRLSTAPDRYLIALQVAMNPQNTVFDAKRLIGRKFTDPSVQDDIKHWPFKVVDGPDHKPLIEGPLSCLHRHDARCMRHTGLNMH